MLNFIKEFFQGILDDDEQAPPVPTDAPEKETFDIEAFNMTTDIKVYALSTCIHCRNAKKYLDECGVKYQCVHIDELTGDERKEMIQELKNHNPAVSFPTMVIKGKVVVGFHKDKIKNAINDE